MAFCVAGGRVVGGFGRVAPEKGMPDVRGRITVLIFVDWVLVLVFYSGVV